MKDLGKVQYILRIKVFRDHKNKKIVLGISYYSIP